VIKKLQNKSREQKKVYYIFGIGLICFLFLSLLFFSNFFSKLNLELTDNLYGQDSHIKDIIIIAIDDDSMVKIGTWPWSRDVYSQLLSKINQSKVIAFDISFFKNGSGDDEFVKAIENSQTPIVFGFEYMKIIKVKDELKGSEPMYPIESFYKFNNTYVGYVNVITNEDGKIRQLPLNLSEEKDNQMSLTEKVYQIFMGKEHKKELLNINFVGGPNTFETISFYDVISNNTNKYNQEYFKNKIIFVGSSSPNLNDNHFVPTSNGIPMPGVEIHANALNTMLTKSYLSYEKNIYVILSIFIIAIIISLFTIYLSTKLSIIFSLLILIGHQFSSIFFFANGTIINLVYVPLTIILTLICQIILIYNLEKKHKQELLSAFKKYVSKEVVEEIAKNPDKIKFGGEKKQLTILFSDIRSFTTISESMTPTELVSLLNEYLSIMTEIVMKNKGLVDKFIGDAIMAFWGAPLDNNQSEIDACNTALEMSKALDDLNKKRKEKNLKEINIGIGLNSGEAIVGNLGSKDRFDYTAIGDSVNTSSRYEGLTKYYGIRIIVGEKTYEKVKDKFIFRELDRVIVKGKKEITTIYELLCKKESNEENKTQKHFEKLSKDFHIALIQYRNRNFDVAKDLFAKIYEKNNDYPSFEMIKRCDENKLTPPNDNWEGELIMKDK
jgi:adenylate cyclase